jgi:hypothetical protein
MKEPIVVKGVSKERPRLADELLKRSIQDKLSLNKLIY